ncbi:MAG: hypothetical protein ACJAXI_001397 [Crocinitomicaceae bacterium]
MQGLVKNDMEISLVDMVGKIIETKTIFKGQTIAYFDVSTVYSGTYFVKVSIGDLVTTSKVVVQ